MANCAVSWASSPIDNARDPKNQWAVVRFDGWVSAILATNRFNSALGQQQALLCYVALCNHQLPNSTSKGKLPVQTAAD